MQPTRQKNNASSLDRSDIVRVLFLVIGIIFVGRLFYLQIIKHDYYAQKAVLEHTTRFEIPAVRGNIEIHDGGDATVPIVLNETRYTIYADPSLMKDSDKAKTIENLSTQLSLSTDELKGKLDQETQYVVLAKRLTSDQRQKVIDHKIPGIRSKPQNYRTYPQGELAAQLLGFVNEEGSGQYGVEEYHNDILGGIPGSLKAITDNSSSNPVPLANLNDEVLLQPKPGKTAVLGIDLSIQKIAEEALKESIDKTKAKSGSVLVIDPNSGLLKAMANYPTYDPAKFQEIKDLALFSNPIVSSQFEVGSIMKTLTVATALNEGVIGRESSYSDPAQYTIDGSQIRNAIEYGAGTKTTTDILVKSLNTGVVYLLTQLGGGQINDKARTTLHDYFVNHFGFSALTGIDQPGEITGAIASPTVGDGLNIRYANNSFGQGVSVSMIQVGAALSSALNGGTYYQPHVVEGWKDDFGDYTPAEVKILRNDVVSETTSNDLRVLMQRVAEANNPAAVRAGYRVGGKSGTAQIPDGKGGYRTDAYLGTYVGFIGGEKPDYVVLIRVDEPGVPGFAGAVSAAPVFAKISNGILNRFAISPVQ